MYNIPPERFRNEFKIWHYYKSKGFFVPFLFDRQFDIRRKKRRATLVSGPRKSGKTHGLLHDLVDHGWQTRPAKNYKEGGIKGAQVAMFSRTIKNARDGGTWNNILKVVIPEWAQNCPGFELTTFDTDGNPGQKTDGVTRTPYFRFKSKHGGEAEFRLFSLDHDKDIEDKIKEQSFTAIYFSELDKFKDRSVFSVTMPSLRSSYLNRNEMYWIADTNPSEEGEESWIYEMFYQERLCEYDGHCAIARKRGFEPMPPEVFRQFQEDMTVIEIKPEENPCIDPKDIIELKAIYSYDPDLYKRYVEGKWVLGKGNRSRHFSGYFFMDIHVEGDVSALDEKDWQVLIPRTTTFGVITGWDLGDTNHSAHIIDKHGEKEKSIYYVLDEHVSIGVDLSTVEFSEGFMEKLKRLDRTAGRVLFTERNWSDRSSIEKYNSTGDTFQYLEVLAATGARIFLQGVPKGPGSVRQRVRLIKRLLHERRLFVSAHCTATIEMLKNLRKGSTEDQFVVSNVHKHPFDSLSYALLMEMSGDLEEQSDEAKVGKRAPVEYITI